MSKEVKAQAVMDFVEMIRGAYASGFIDNHPTNYDIYRSAQMHVKDRYGVEADNWDDELADESRKDNHDRLVDENAALREMLISAGEEMQAVIGRLNQYESKDFRCDQLDPPELTDMQTVSEIQWLLSKGEDCV